MIEKNVYHHEINLLDYWKVIKRYKKMIVVIMLTVSMGAVIISFIIPESYHARALVIPIAGKGGGGGLASQFGGIASLVGVPLSGGANETEKIIAILKSRTLTEAVITNEYLLSEFFPTNGDEKKQSSENLDFRNSLNMELAVEKMRKIVSIMDDKKNKTIEISAIFRKPELAARVVNAYLRELQTFINNNAFTMAKRNRIFIETQLEQNKKELLEAGKEINQFYSGKAVSSADAKIDVPVISINKFAADYKEINDTSVNIVSDSKAQNSIINYAEASLPTVDTEITKLMVKKDDIERKITEAKSVKDVPQQVYLSYLMLRRELLTKVNALLTGQYEMAKIDESKEDLTFQIIDKAVPPVKRCSPARARICIMSFVAAFFGAVFLAFFREYIKKMKEMSHH